MPTKTFDLVGSTTADGSSSTVVFSGLSSLSYNNYCIIISAATGNFNSRLTLRVNGVSSTSYGNVALSNIAGSASASDQNDQNIWTICQPSNYIGQQISNNLTIIDFANKTTNQTYASFNAKMISAEGGVTYGISSGQFYVTGATSSLTIGNTQNDNFMANSTFFLFGIV